MDWTTLPDIVKWPRAAVTLALSILAIAHLRATVIVPAELGELVLAARAIAHGRIVDLRPQVSDARRHVETLVTIQVATYLKGDLGPTVTFRVPGGQIGRYRTVVLDAPQFTQGEEVVLMLSSRGPSIPYVLGLNQGVFRVVRTPDDRWLVAPPPMLPSVSAVRIARGDPSRRPQLLADFEARVRALAGGAR